MGAAVNDLPPLPPPDRTMHQYGKQIDHFTADQMRAYAQAALEATSNAEQTKEAAGHRLALELECLLLDCKDNVVVSRWMDTACEALDAWQRLFPYNGPRLGD